jgi:hypothetical protein
MLEARVATSIHEVGRAAWHSCFADGLEGFDYLSAVEAASLPGFAWRYVLVECGGTVIAAAPGFLTDYALDTTLNGTGRRLVAAARRLAPRAFTVRLAALGSPCTEDVSLGFAPGLGLDRRREALRVLLAAFEAAAADAGCGLLAIKDAPAADRRLWSGLERPAYQLAPGMPVAELDIDFGDLDGYLARLSSATRKDLRRKLKALETVRIEVRGDIHGLESRVVELYRQTRARSNLQFEELTAAYFTGVLAAMPERALCVLYFVGDELIGCNLLLHDGRLLLDKFFCMESERGPAHNLYFLSWITNVRLCLERGLACYQSGQAGYATKLRLGSRLRGADMYFRHRQPLVNRALKWAAPLLAEDPVPMRGAA